MSGAAREVVPEGPAPAAAAAPVPAEAAVAAPLLSTEGGNRLVARRVLARQGTTIPTPPPATAPGTAPGTPGGSDADAAKELHTKLFANDREAALKHAMTLSGRYDALKAEYPEAVGVELDDDIKRGMGFVPDAARVSAYLRRGTLRTADKIYLAVEETGTDEDTLFRLLPQAHASGGGVSRDFAADYGTEYPSDGTLLDGRPDRIAGVLGGGSAEHSGAEWVKGMAAHLRAHARRRHAAGGDRRDVGSATPASTQRCTRWASRPAAPPGSTPSRRSTSRPTRRGWGPTSRRSSGRGRTRRGGPSSCCSARGGPRSGSGSPWRGVGTGWKEVWSALEDATPDELKKLRAERESKEKDGLYDLIGGELTATQADTGRMEALLQAGAPKEGEKLGIDVLVKAKGVEDRSPRRTRSSARSGSSRGSPGRASTPAPPARAPPSATSCASWTPPRTP